MDMQQIQQMMQSPLFKRATDMAAACKSKEELEQIARNICASKGINYESTLTAFTKQFGCSPF